jgi:lipopolysaccharide transport system permease protein
VASAATSRPVGHVTVIQPTTGWVIPRVRDLWDRRDLLGYFFIRDVKIRYAQTALGGIWAFFQPLGMMLVFTFAFRKLGHVYTEAIAYPVYAFTGLTFWTFFSRAVLTGADSLATNAAILTKTALPRLLLPTAAVLSALFDFIVTFCIMLVLVAFFGYYPSWRLALIPLCMAVGILLAFGMSLILSAINVRYRDIRNMLPMFVQLLLFASPVVYTLNTLGTTWTSILSINPLVGIIQGFRWAVVGSGPPAHVAIEASLGGTALLLVSGLVYFARMERVFADVA